MSAGDAPVTMTPGEVAAAMPTKAGVTTQVRETTEYERLWPDGTFDSLKWSDEGYSRKRFQEKAYELKDVPKSLRPVFGKQRVVTTIDRYLPEAVPDATK